MKKFIYKTTLFIFFALAFYIVTLCIWGNFAPSFLKRNLKTFDVGFSISRFNQVKETSNLDLLIIGSSHAYLNFDTRYYSKLGYKTFNLGSSAQTPIQTEILMNRYLDQLNPKIVIFTVNHGVFSSDAVESYFDIIGSDIIDEFLVKKCLEINHVLVYNSLIYHGISTLFGLNKNKKIEPSYSGYTYIDGGYVEKELSFFKNVQYKKPFTHKFNSEQFAAFNRIIKTFKDRNIKVILIKSPITEALYNTYTVNAEFDKTMSLAGEYYNYNEMARWNDSLDFFDDSHLNLNGVEKFNFKVIQDVFKQTPNK
jgi:hypothetical protein